MSTTHRHRHSHGHGHNHSQRRIYREVDSEESQSKREIILTIVGLLAFILIVAGLLQLMD